MKKMKKFFILLIIDKYILKSCQHLALNGNYNQNFIG